MRPNDGTVGAKSASPIGVIQNDGGRRGRRVIGRSERAADEGVDAERREKIAGDVHAVRDAGGAVAAEVDVERTGEGGHAGEGVGLRANGFEKRQRRMSSRLLI